MCGQREEGVEEDGTGRVGKEIDVEGEGKTRKKTRDERVGNKKQKRGGITSRKVAKHAADACATGSLIAFSQDDRRSSRASGEKRKKGRDIASTDAFILHYTLCGRLVDFRSSR